jgi:hypothetical protein
MLRSARAIGFGKNKVNGMPLPRRAIYLVGHGPYRQPRLIELQHLRILRYRDLVGDSADAHVFTDVNFPRSPDPMRPTELPEFARLRKAIKAKQYRSVYVDLEIGSGFKPYEFMFVPQLLQEAGAKVFNVFYDDGDVLEASLSQRYGNHAHADEVDDASDFINFFPTYTGTLIERSLRELENQENKNNPLLTKINRHIDGLKKDNPYRGGRPFVERGLEHEWYRRRSRKEES